MTSVLDGSVASPFALLRWDALRHNISRMQAWCRDHAVELAPHGKTTMAPVIFAQQLEAGAWGLTVANAAQAQVAVDAGATRVIVANEVTDLAGMRALFRLREQHPPLRLLCYVDSMDGVALLDAVAREIGEPVAGQELEVLLELGIAGQRAGVRDDEVAVRVARAVAATPTLRLAGVAGFEGLIPVAGSAGPASTVSGEGGGVGVAQVAAFCRRIVAMGRRLVDEGMLAGTPGVPVILSAGGSTYFDTVASTLRDNGYGAVVVLRSGCYVTHDHGLYGRSSPLARGGDGPVLQPALEVWARVLSRPEPTRAILDAGRRDVSYDVDLPVPLWACSGSRTAPGVPQRRPLSARVVALSDQHAWVDLAADDPLGVGDWVRLGISHPCTTFDKWRTLLVVDEAGRRVGDVATYF